MNRVLCAVAITSVAIAVGLAPHAIASADRTATVTKHYTAANIVVSHTQAQLTAVRFTPPKWARSAVITVTDASGRAIVDWTDWGYLPTENCSAAYAGGINYVPIPLLMHPGGTDLLIAPGGSNDAYSTFDTCPAYVNTPTVGTITVTFHAVADPAECDNHGAPPRGPDWQGKAPPGCVRVPERPPDPFVDQIFPGSP